MPKHFHDKLINLLKTDRRFIDDEGELVKAAVIDRAWQIDHDLVRLLLCEPDIKAKFFDEIEGHYIFNTNTFINYISDKNFLANSYTRFRNKIGLNIEDKFLPERGEVSLVWPYKDCVLEGGQTQEEEKRKEIFFNAILAQDEIDRLFDPKVLTQWKRHTADGEQKVTGIRRDENGTIRENLIIKGNNLLALHTLKTQFRGKVKLIYIDPPYNTGGEANVFTYNNNFNHSSWLTFMKNRLEVAREFLKDNGFIAIAIDHYELFYLGSIADEVFGRENRVGILTIIHHPAGKTNNDFFATTNEFLLVYAKYKELTKINFFEMTEETEKTFSHEDEVSRYKLEKLMRKGETRNARREDRPKQFYPIYVSRDLKQISLTKVDGYHELLPVEDRIEWVWSNSPSTLQEKIDKGELVPKRRNDGSIQVFFKRRITDYQGQRPKTTWTDKKYNATFHGTRLLEKIIGRKSVSYPKSLYAVLDTLKIMTDKDDIIFDFFAGSGTTGHAVIELNKEDGGSRKFILVEQLEEHVKICNERIQKVMQQEDIDDSFVCCELMPYNQAFMDKIQASQSSEALVALWRDIAENSFLNWYVNAKIPEDAIADFIAIGHGENGLEKQKKLLAELLDKNQLYVNLSEIADEDFGVSAEDKALNRAFYGNGLDNV